jgi:hypothetical protein
VILEFRPQKLRTSNDQGKRKVAYIAQFLYTEKRVLDSNVIHVPFFIPIIGGLLAAGLVGGTVGVGVGAAAAYYYYHGRPMYYPVPAANYTPYPYYYAVPPSSPGRVCPHCGAAI